ncbi:MAPEG family protein [Hellea sp.]|nr:MAPEG family protein [Hellea sp.]
MSHFLAPVLALILWSLIIWCVMYARRIPAMQKAKIDPDTAKSPDGDWKEKMPLKVQAAAHNYNHLMEQPTIFYALMFYIVLTNGESSLMGYLAWAFVILRVLHSLVQVSAGKVIVRFAIFSLSTIVLIVMACAQAAKLFS